MWQPRLLFEIRGVEPSDSALGQKKAEALLTLQLSGMIWGFVLLPQIQEDEAIL